MGGNPTVREGANEVPMSCQCGANAVPQIRLRTLPYGRVSAFVSSVVNAAAARAALIPAS